MKQAKSKKSRKRAIVLSVVALVVVAGAAAGYLVLRGAAARRAQAVGTASVAVTKGDISATVYGSGSLAANVEDDILATAPGQVEAVLAQQGDEVAGGAPLFTLSADTLDQTIKQLESTISSYEAQLSRLRTAPASSYITAPAAGRVKAIYAGVGDSVEDLQQLGAPLLLLSADGTMCVSFENTAKLAVGQAVAVTAGEVSVKGSVVSAAGEATVSVDDNAFDDGVTVRVLLDGTAVGEGTLRIHAPVSVAGTGGVVGSVLTSVGKTVSRGAKLFKLETREYGDEYLSVLKERESALADLAEAKAQRQALTIYAPYAGVLSSVTTRERANVQQYDTLAVIESTGEFKLVVNVDELDVASVALGQDAEVSVTAFPYKVFAAKVTHISAMGSAQNGVASYPVTLTLTDNEGLKSGMSASAEIVTQHSAAALLVPKSALTTHGAKSFVSVVQADGSMAQVEVTVGISNADFAEILSGLAEGDHVAVSASTTDSLAQLGMMGGMNGMGPVMRVDGAQGGGARTGGQAPSGVRP